LSLGLHGAVATSQPRVFCRRDVRHGGPGRLRARPARLRHPEDARRAPLDPWPPSVAPFERQRGTGSGHRAGLPLPTELLPFHLARGGRGTARAAWPPLPPRALAPAVFRLPSSIPCRVDTIEQLRDRLCHLMVHEVTNDCDERLGSRHASSPLFRARYPNARASAKASPLRRRPTRRNAAEPLHHVQSLSRSAHRNVAAKNLDGQPRFGASTRICPVISGWCIVQ
jgi:hypothetical protein